MRRAVPTVLVILLLCIGAFPQTSNHFEQVQKAAESGDANAQNELGVMYAQGDGVEKNYERAAYWYGKAAAQGNKYAQNNLGTLYENGKGVVADIVRAVSLYRQSAQQQGAGAQNNLGRLYEVGKGVPKDMRQAAEWYRKGAENGDKNAQYNLARIYKNGTSGLGRDLKQAAYWYQKAAEQDDADAQLAIGVMYLAGDGVAQDFDKASTWLKKAAEQGNAAAEYQLWNIGIGNKRYMLFSINDEELAKMPDAFEHLRKAADAGYPLAQADMGEVFCNFAYRQQAEDSMTCKDVIPYLEQAALKGNIRAQTKLGDVFSGEEQAWGDSVSKHATSAKAASAFPRLQAFPQSCEKAMYWYTRAAIQNDPYAMGAIGQAYGLGRCLPVDTKRAWGWLRMARLTAGGDYPKSPMHKDMMGIMEKEGGIRTPAAKQQALQLVKAELAGLKKKDWSWAPVKGGQ